MSFPFGLSALCSHPYIACFHFLKFLNFVFILSLCHVVLPMFHVTFVNIDWWFEASMLLS
jgi:hypothetical protein